MSANDFGAWLQAHTVDVGISRTEVMRRMGRLGAPVTRQTLGSWYKGVQPRYDTCLVLAQALGVTQVEVLTAAGHVRPDVIDKLTSNEPTDVFDRFSDQDFEILRRIILVLGGLSTKQLEAVAKIAQAVADNGAHDI